MRIGGVIAIVALLVAAGAVTAQGSGRTKLVDEQQRLVDAKRGAAIAASRAARLAAAAAQERDTADMVRREEQALAASVTAAEANLVTAGARVVLVERLLSDQRAKLGHTQAPVARLLAALASIARRPTIVAVAQPGSVDDLVHVRAVLGSALPVVRSRSAAVRNELAKTRRLQANVALAARALADGRGQLENNRLALARLEAQHRQRSRTLGRVALSESDRAMALGERARELVDGMAETSDARATAASLIALAGPLPRPIAPGRPPTPSRSVYRRPVDGRLVTGFDELSDSGVRSRGLTFVTGAGVGVVAPAGGIVRYAKHFRDYGAIVIIDHADGWTSLVTGLGTMVVRPGDRIVGGAAIGTAPRADEPRITVELRRRGRPVDAATLIGPR
jgi:murein DD-endopeptidase MepM/ murein hydrolase activator NlpD